MPDRGHAAVIVASSRHVDALIHENESEHGDGRIAEAGVGETMEQRCGTGVDDAAGVLVLEP